MVPNNGHDSKADIPESNDTPVKKRRIRYKGTHPRRFEEKYKEQNPEKYAEDIKKVLARGQTPAGMHIPICVHEIVSVLNPKPGEIGLDATLGFGGHTCALVQKIIPGGKLYAIDVDPIELPKTEERLRSQGFSENVLVIKRMNFAGSRNLLNEVPEGFDFILADLGVSSMQIDDPKRGFTFKHDGPLDLRLNPQKGKPASNLLKEMNEESLIEMLVKNSDEPHAKKIASAIKKSANEIITTKQLSSVIENALQNLSFTNRQDEIKKSKQRTFQALRIAVNEEFDVLDQFLIQIPEILKPGGRIAILTFHSGEDRRVKRTFKELKKKGVFEEIARDPIRASAKERHDNPRSISAKLRWGRRGRDKMLKRYDILFKYEVFVL